MNKRIEPELISTLASAEHVSDDAKIRSLFPLNVNYDQTLSARQLITANYFIDYYPGDLFAVSISEADCNKS